jgi:TPR repeat protein
MKNLGSMYLQGREVARDPVRALELCGKAAESGYAAAQNNPALMYASGHGVVEDGVWAYVWLDPAADKIPAAAGLRDRIAKQRTPGQIATARKRVTAERAQGTDR